MSLGDSLFSVATLTFSKIHRSSFRPDINGSRCSSSAFICFAEKSEPLAFVDGHGSNGVFERLVVLVIGGGGREQALCYALKRSPSCDFVFRAPGSGRTEDKSEWWVVDGEMHEIGDHVPPRERFVISRDNIPNKRRKQLREQYMRRTRLVIKESKHEPWCKRYMELYELRENLERLYWNEGYSKKIAKDHANYDSAEDEEDQDFNPYRGRGPRGDLMKDQGFVRNRQAHDNLGKVNQLRDKFEFDREKRMREKAFAPMNGQNASNGYDTNSRKHSKILF